MASLYNLPCCHLFQNIQFTETEVTNVENNEIRFSEEEIIQNDEYIDIQCLQKSSGYNIPLKFIIRENLPTDSLNFSLTRGTDEHHFFHIICSDIQHIKSHNMMTGSLRFIPIQYKEQKMSFKLKSMRQYLLENSF